MVSPSEGEIIVCAYCGKETLASARAMPYRMPTLYHRPLVETTRKKGLLQSENHHIFLEDSRTE